eukprot:6174969-Pleurochrysis_carterae.AAC.2
MRGGGALSHDLRKISLCAHQTRPVRRASIMLARGASMAVAAKRFSPNVPLRTGPLLLHLSW